MIPSERECLRLLDEYRFPAGAREHVTRVAAVAVFLAIQLNQAGEALDLDFVRAAALLHDLGKSPGVPRDVDHATASARLVAERGYPELYEAVRRHILGSVLDPNTRPRDLAEKLVYYADKLVARDFIGLEERFRDLKRRYPGDAGLLARCWPKVKAIEGEIFRPLPFGPGELPRRMGVHKAL